MRVELDSNILFSALISPHGPPHRIYQAWRANRFELVTCSIQLAEIRRASRYPKFRDLLQPHRVGRMVNDLQGALVIDQLPAGHESADPNDTWLLALSRRVPGGFPGDGGQTGRCPVAGSGGHRAYSNGGGVVPDNADKRAMGRGTLSTIDRGP